MVIEKIMFQKGGNLLKRVEVDTWNILKYSEMFI